MPTLARVTRNATAGRTHLSAESEVVRLQRGRRLEGSLAEPSCPGLLLKEMTAAV